MHATYECPRYFRDSPPVVRGVADTLAKASVDALKVGIKEAYPGLNEDSLEFGQLMAAVFHKAEWLSLHGK